MRTDKQRKADKQESDWADLIGGTLVKGSGSHWRGRQDVKSDHFLWSCKGTDAKSISLKSEWWEELRAHAYAEGKEPGLHLEVRGGSPTRRLVVLDEADFLMLMRLIGWGNG